MEKIIVVGANHAGTHSILTIAQNYKETAQVTTYDKNDNISFLGCGMALWIGDVIEGPNGLFYANPKVLEDEGVNVNMNSEVTNIDFDKKVVTVKNQDGSMIEDDYDKIILATGSWPILPNIPGIDFENVYYAKIYQNAEAVIEKIEDKDIKDVVVVGAGYIGVELAEAFKIKGKNVTLVSNEGVVNNYYDKEFQTMMEERLKENGITLALGENVTQINGDGVVTGVTTSKNTYDADVVIMSVGFKPNTEFLKDSKLNFASNGAIKVNEYQETSIDGVYAVGDCATIYSNATKKDEYIALATNAVRTGIVAGHNACNTKIPMQGVQGSNAIHIYGLTMCSTGINEEQAKQLNINYSTVTVTELLKPAFMKDNDEVILKVVWDKDSRRILGAQIVSTTDITLALHFFSMAIQENYSIDRLALLDLFFLPHFNQPVNFITKAGLLALGK